MEDQLKHVIEPLLRENSPDTLRAKLVHLFDSPNKPAASAEDYLMARSSGLTISEAELALAIFHGIQAQGLEAVLLKLEKANKHPVKLKRKRRKHQEDADTKKKSKL